MAFDMKVRLHTLAALAIFTMLVTFGVSLAKKGIDVTSLTQVQMFLTISWSCPQARPIPLSPKNMDNDINQILYIFA